MFPNPIAKPTRESMYSVLFDQFGRSGVTPPSSPQASCSEKIQIRPRFCNRTSFCLHKRMKRINFLIILRQMRTRDVKTQSSRAVIQPGFFDPPAEKNSFQQLDRGPGELGSGTAAINWQHQKQRWEIPSWCYKFDLVDLRLRQWNKNLN